LHVLKLLNNVQSEPKSVLRPACCGLNLAIGVTEFPALAPRCGFYAASLQCSSVLPPVAPIEAGFSRRPFTRLQRPPGCPSYHGRVDDPDLSLRLPAERSPDPFGFELPSSLAISGSAGKLVVQNPLPFCRPAVPNRY
jgi:hypothetical protein